MISLETAKALKAAGLVWRPGMLDFFGIPDRQMDDKIFAISDVLVTVEMLHGAQVVAFQGASEWALDSLVTSEAVWIPREEQLRLALEGGLLATGRPELRLVGSLTGYRCEFVVQGKLESFEAPEAGEAYAQGLLFLLRKQAAQAGGQDSPA